VPADGLPFDGAARVDERGCLEEQCRVRRLSWNGLGRGAEELGAVDSDVLPE
jgi:hypothetical protein